MRSKLDTAPVEGHPSAFSLQHFSGYLVLTLAVNYLTLVSTYLKVAFCRNLYPYQTVP